MEVTVKWRNAVRVGQERAAIEAVYADRLLSLCGGPLAAWNYHQAHYQQHQPPASQWARLNAVALCDATVGLLPTERPSASFKVLFWSDGLLLNP